MSKANLLLFVIAAYVAICSVASDEDAYTDGIKVCCLDQRTTFLETI